MHLVCGAFESIWGIIFTRACMRRMDQNLKFDAGDCIVGVVLWVALLGPHFQARVVIWTYFLSFFSDSLALLIAI